jgi:hypothetical protein
MLLSLMKNFYVQKKEWKNLTKPKKDENEST